MEQETLRRIEEKIDNLPTNEDLREISEDLQALIIMLQRQIKI